MERGVKGRGKERRKEKRRGQQRRGEGERTGKQKGMGQVGGGGVAEKAVNRHWREKEEGEGEIKVMFPIDLATLLLCR